MTGNGPHDGAMTRRALIGTGAALGASLYLPSWSWAGTQSVAGIGGTTPPWLVWDDEADAVIAAVIERGEVPRSTRCCAAGPRTPRRCPTGCRPTCATSSSTPGSFRRGPTTGKLKAAVEFNKKRGTYLGVAYGFVSGMMSTVIPHEARAVYYSKGGADMKRRISRTAKFGYDIGSLGGFHDPNGEMVVTAVKTRMAHAGVRHLLPQSPHWKDAADERKPISQRDILVTWHSLPTSVMRSMKKWGVKVPAAEADAFLHSWQVAAHMLGVKDEYIPATWDAAYAQAPQILDPVLAPTPEGIKLADILLDLAADTDGGVVTRPAAGVADALLPRRRDRRVAGDPPPPGPGRDARRDLAAVRAPQGGRPAGAGLARAVLGPRRDPAPGRALVPVRGPAALHRDPGHQQPEPLLTAEVSGPW